MKVYFIGGGPGDPELLTIKAVKIIRKADVIIYAGSLINKDILKLASRNAAVYDSSDMTLEEILSVIEKRKVGNDVIVRIHSGDLSIYSAVQEQIEWCKRRKIDYELIPGISSFQSVSASLGQEFTLPGVSQTVILTRISGRTKVPRREDLKYLAKIKSTMVIFLSIDRIDSVVKRLKDGYDLDTPVVVMEKVSWPEERKITGTLRDIVRKVRQAGIKRQALIVVGEVLNRNFQRSKLYCKDFGHGFRKKE